MVRKNKIEWLNSWHGSSQSSSKSVTSYSSVELSSSCSNSKYANNFREGILLKHKISKPHSLRKMRSDRNASSNRVDINDELTSRNWTFTTWILINRKGIIFHISFDEDPLAYVCTLYNRLIVFAILEIRIYLTIAQHSNWKWNIGLGLVSIRIIRFPKFRWKT